MSSSTESSLISSFIFTFYQTQKYIGQFQIQRKIFTVKLSMVIGRTEGVLPVLLHTKTRREHSQSSSDLSPFSSHRVPKKSTHNSFNLSGQRFCAAAAVAAALHYTEGEVHQSCFNPLLMKKDRVCVYVITFFSYFKMIRFFYKAII